MKKPLPLGSGFFYVDFVSKMLSR